MPVYGYQARDAQGKVVAGVQEAASESSAVRILQSRDLIVTRLTPLSSDSQRKTKAKRKHRKVKSEDLLFFIRQEATLLDAGIPLLRSIEIIANQVNSLRLLEALEKVKHDIRSGTSLRDSLSRHPKIFPPLWIHLIEAGETSGNLPLVLDQLATNLEANMNLRKKLVSAMVYPAVLIAIAIGAVLVFLLKIIPIFSKLFKMFNAKLPAITVVVIGISDFLRVYFLPIFGALLVAGFFAKRYLDSPAGRAFRDRTVLRIPLFESFVRDGILARVSINLATLIKSGVNLLKSIEIVSQISGNTVYQAALLNVSHDVQQGKSLSGALAQNSLFPPMMVDMIMIGEESGRLPDMMSRVAKYYEDRVDTFIGRISTLIEPVILVFIGALVGFLVVAIFLPIFSLSTVVK
ncbi:MAG: Type II secretion system protein F [Candidatus Omnitrophica bacterium]|nr:Type II secretion system protein F [Candidatus Omnitrophota bacterium]